MSVGIGDAGRLHRLAGALHDAADAGLADEHVVRFLGQHEAAGARQRIEAGLRQRVQLHLAVAVGEIGEHEERQPVRRRLVEGAEHARRIRVAGAAAQQIVGLLAAVAAEIFLQQIDHRPEMAAFLDIDLEQVAHVVERGRGLAEMALLLDRGRLGVALDHDQAAQHGAIFARDFLPGRLAEMLAERNDAVLFLRRQQNAPAIIRHLDVVELGPAARIDRIGGAQIDQRLLEALRPHVAPPVDVAGMPALQRFQHLAVFGEIHVVGNLGRVVDVHDVHGVLLGVGLVVPDAVQRVTSACSSGPWRVSMDPVREASFAHASHPGQDSLNPRHIELRLLAGAVAAQRAVFADRVGALEDPVLPRRQAREDFRIPWSRARRSADWLPCR